MSSHGKKLYDTGTMKVRGTAPSSHSTPAGSLDVPHQPDFCSFFFLWSDPAEAMMWLVSSRYWRQPLSSLFKLCLFFFFIFYFPIYPWMFVVVSAASLPTAGSKFGAKVARLSGEKQLAQALTGCSNDFWCGGAGEAARTRENKHTKLTSFGVCEAKTGWRLGRNKNDLYQTSLSKLLVFYSQCLIWTFPPPEGKQSLGLLFPVFPVLTPSPFCFLGLIISSAGADWCMSELNCFPL